MVCFNKFADFRYILDNLLLTVIQLGYHSYNQTVPNTFDVCQIPLACQSQTVLWQGISQYAQPMN